MTVMLTRPLPAVRRGLTLVEVLLAVFILGIGVISIAALFPAGIAQQRQSNDDAIGSIVAENALSVVRTRVRPEDFGWGAGTNPIDAPLPGDFVWARPGLVLANGGVNFGGELLPKGSITIFGSPGGAGAMTSEIPHNEALYGNSPPAIVLTQRDRQWPMAATYGQTEGPTDGSQPRPQYAWEVMFRRFQGRVLVAIFVYRVTLEGGAGAEYAVAQQLPARRVFSPAWPAGTIEVPGTTQGTPFMIGSSQSEWQRPGQWLLDQTNVVHRVLNGRRRQSDGSVRLAAPTPNLLYSPVHVPNPGTSSVVSDIWFIPGIDAAGNSLTPVFVMVKEL